MADRTEMTDRVQVTLTLADLELVREALWVASQAELAAMTDDEALRQALLAELRDLIQRREQAGKATFRDRYLPLVPDHAGPDRALDWRPARSFAGLAMLGIALLVWSLRRWLR